MNKNLLFRSIPKVDILLEEQEIQDLIDVYGRELVMDVIREEMDALRTFIRKVRGRRESESADRDAYAEYKTACRKAA